MQMHSDQEYIDTDPFQGDEAELTCRTIAIRKAAKEHTCYSLTGKQDHTIKRGERYRYETARVDGSFWGVYRICLSCLDKFIEGDY